MQKAQETADSLAAHANGAPIAHGTISALNFDEFYRLKEDYRIPGLTKGAAV